MDSSSSTASPQIPTLDYPGPLSRWGVMYERWAWGMRVIMPPFPSWRHVGWGWYIAAGWLLLMTGYGPTIWWTTGDPVGALVGVLTYSLPFVCVVGTVVHRVRNRFIAVVTRETLSIGYFTPGGRASVARWPRRRVIEVRAARSGVHVIVRVQGEDMREFPGSVNAEVTAWVVEQVRAALAGEFEPLPAEGVPLLPTPTPASRRETAFLRAALLAVTISMAVTGAVGLLLTDARVWSAILIVVALAMLTVVGGMLYGTWQREFYC